MHHLLYALLKTENSRTTRHNAVLYLRVLIDKSVTLMVVKEILLATRTFNHCATKEL
jgi:hypothetical protein